MVGSDLLENDRKRYADDITLQELVRLRVENERLLEALHTERKLRNHALELAIDLQKEVDRLNGYSWSVAAALQQKETE